MTRSALFGKVVARLALGALATALVWSAAIGPARAQVQPGAICVSTFADLNGNGAREEGEAPLPGVTVNLSTGGAVIASHVMAEGEDQHCFESLLTGAYTITFLDSPAFRTTTANEGTFNLDPGQRLTITPFGGAPVAADPAAEPGATPATEPMADQLAQTGATVLETGPAKEPLNPSVRLAISAAAALAVMVFMTGVGAIVLGMRGLRPRRGRRRAGRGTRHIPPPARIAPPRV